MKLKGINPFEQHVEKIVLGAAIACVGGVAAWQVISAPSVKVGTKDVAPSEVDALLEQKAQALQKQLRGESNITIPSDGVPLASPTFATALSKDVTPAKRLAISAPSFADMLVKSDVTSADIWYYEPKLAGVSMRSPVPQTADALTPESAKEAKRVVPDLEKFFTTSEGPQDVVWTTPSAVIDLKAIRAELARADAAAKPARSAIPGVWYQETPYIVDVVFERQSRREDGTWNAPTEVPLFTPDPESWSFRKDIPGAQAQLRDQMFASLKDPAEQMQILQLPFFETVNNAFVSPSVAETAAPTGQTNVAASEQVRLHLQWRSQLNDKKMLLQRKSTELERLGGPYDDAAEREKEEQKKREEEERKDQERKGNKGGGNKGGGFGGGMGGGGMSGRRTTSGPGGEKETKAKLEQRRELTKLTKRIQAEIVELEKRLGATPSTATAEAAKLPNMATDDEVLVWGHDLAVSPGKEYRYRCSVRLYNPFFARGNQLVREQEEAKLAQSFVMDTRVSEWSEPVRVSPRVRFFVTQATAGAGVLGMGSADVEVYRLVDGQWRLSEMRVQPGERIGRVDDRSKTGGKTIDFTTDFYVSSIVEDFSAQKGGADRGSRRPAFVVVRQLTAGPEEERWPILEGSDPERMSLYGDAKAAELRDAAPPSDATKSSGGGAPSPGSGGSPGAGGPGISR